MLIIHIGSPKTGTTAIQGFLKTNRDLLFERGLNFVAAGRTNISHNSTIKPFLRGKGASIFSAILDEINAEPDRIHVISSELFFRPRMAAVLADGLSNATHDVKVCGFVRRPDKYAEAMYKQKVKNGRITADPSGFLTAFMPRLQYSPVLSTYRDAFGADAMHIRPFEKHHLKDGDVVSDFLEAIGGVDTTGCERPEGTVNKTLSRAVSEHLGRVSKNTSYNTRIMLREISAASAENTVRSGDVYDRETRKQILAETAKDRAVLATLYFSDIQNPFDLSDLDAVAPDTFPSAEEALLLERAASDAIMEAIGRQERLATPPT